MQLEPSDTEITPTDEIDSSRYIPRLHPGIFLIEGATDSGEIYVGTSHRGIWLSLGTHFELQSVLREIRQGAKSILQLSEKYQLRAELIQDMLQPLIEENLLSLAPPPLSEGFRNSRGGRNPRSQKLTDAHTLHIEERMMREENISRWRSPENPADEIRSRENFSLLIFGQNPLAITIYSLLQASGFSNCKIISRRRGIKLRSDNYREVTQ